MKRSAFISNILAATLALAACDGKPSADPVAAPVPIATPPPTPIPAPSDWSKPLPVPGLTHDRLDGYGLEQSCEAMLELVQKFSAHYAPGVDLKASPCEFDYDPTRVYYFIPLQVQLSDGTLETKVGFSEGFDGTRSAYVDADLIRVLRPTSPEFARLAPSIEQFIEKKAGVNPLAFGLLYENFLEKAKAHLEEKGFTYWVFDDAYTVFPAFEADRYRREGGLKFHDVPETLLERRYQDWKGLMGCSAEDCLNDGSFSYRIIRNNIIITREGPQRVVRLNKPEDIGL